MHVELVKEIFDACFLAKKVTEMMPELPTGMKPRHIHVIDAIYACHIKHQKARVSDISGALNLTTPSVTKLINELETKKIVEKIPCEDDRRVTFLVLTAYGNDLYQQYVHDYHTKLAQTFSGIDEADAKVFIEVSQQVYELMSRTIEGDLND